MEAKLMLEDNQHTHTHAYVRIKRDVICGKKGSIDICLCGAVKLNSEIEQIWAHLSKQYAMIARE